MRAPPPVEFTSGPSRAWRGALSLLAAAAVAVPLAWGLPYVAALEGGPQLDGLASPAVQAALALAVGAIAFAASWFSRRSAVAGERTLRWDGQDWVLPGDAVGRLDQRGDAALMLDLGPWMLVRFLPYAATGRPGAGVWLPLTAGGDLARWAALRGALWNWRGNPGDARP